MYCLLKAPLPLCLSKIYLWEEKKKTKKLLDLTQTQTKKSNFPGIGCLAKLMSIISAKVKFQWFVQKTKQWSQIKNDFKKKKRIFKDSHSLSADNQTRKPDLKK